MYTRNGWETEHWLSSVIELSVPRRHRMTNLFMLFMLVRFWSSVLQLVSVCFLCVCVERNQYFVNLYCTYVTGWHSFDRCGLMLVCCILRLRPFMYAVCEARTTKKLPLCHGDPTVRSLNCCAYCTYSGSGRVDVDTGALENYGPWSV